MVKIRIRIKYSKYSFSILRQEFIKMYTIIGWNPSELYTFILKSNF